MIAVNYSGEGYIEVRGTFLATGDYQKLKSEIDRIKKEKCALTLRFAEVPFVSSMVLGLIVRLVLVDHVKLTIECDSQETIQFFKSMGLENNVRLRLFEDFVDSKHLR